LKDLVKKILQEIGEDPSREGLKNTPERVEKSLKFLTSGYWVNLEELVNGALFQEDYDEMVIVKDIDLFSMCEHHMLPFIGKCHVAYLPKGKVIGLSKIPRIVDAFSRRLQVQERLTNQIAHCLDKILKPMELEWWSRHCIYACVCVEFLNKILTQQPVQCLDRLKKTLEPAGNF